MPSTGRFTVLPQVDEIERKVMARLLADKDAQRSDGDTRCYDQSADERAQWADLEPRPVGRRGVGRDVANADGSALRALHEEYRGALQRPDTEIVVAAWCHSRARRSEPELAGVVDPADFLIPLARSADARSPSHATSSPDGCHL